MSGPGFQTSDAKGFHVTFENGWTVSVQFGRGNYCDNRDWRGPNPDDPSSVVFAQAPKSRTAEVAAWDANGKWLSFESDDVEGWQSPAQVLELLNRVAGLPAALARAGEA